MGYINDSLSNGEEVKEVFKLHWFSKIPMIIWAILAIPTLGITLLLVIWEWLKLRSIEQGVTNKARQQNLWVNCGSGRAPSA